MAGQPHPHGRPRRRRLLQAAIGGLAGPLMCLAAPGPGKAAPAIVQEQDGIKARLEIAPDGALFSWRFTRRPPAIVDKVEASINGRPTGIPADFQPFPAPGEVTLVMFLIDTGGLDRAANIDGAERAVLETIKALPPGTQTDVAAYNSEFHDIDLPLATKDFRSAVGPKDSTSNLSRGLNQAIGVAASTPATRRAIYVYTDGFNAEPRTLPDARALAINSGTNVTFVLEPSLRLADVASLDVLARATGGKVLTRARDVSTDISFLTSGARVWFPFEGARRLIWEPHATVDVALVYGERRLVLSGPIDVPIAGLRETLRNMGPRERLVAALLGLMVAGFTGILWWRRTARGKTGVALKARGSLES